MQCFPSYTFLVIPAMALCGIALSFHFWGKNGDLHASNLIGIMTYGVQLLDILTDSGAHGSSGLDFLDHFSSLLNFRPWAFRCLFTGYDFLIEFWLRLVVPAAACILWLLFCQCLGILKKNRNAMVYHFMDMFYFPVVLSCMSVFKCIDLGYANQVLSALPVTIVLLTWPPLIPFALSEHCMPRGRPVAGSSDGRCRGTMLWLDSSSVVVVCLKTKTRRKAQKVVRERHRRLAQVVELCVGQCRPLPHVASSSFVEEAVVSSHSFLLLRPLRLCTSIGGSTSALEYSYTGPMLWFDALLRPSYATVAPAGQIRPLCVLAGQFGGAHSIARGDGGLPASHRRLLGRILFKLLY